MGKTLCEKRGNEYARISLHKCKAKERVKAAEAVKVQEQKQGPAERTQKEPKEKAQQGLPEEKRGKELDGRKREREERESESDVGDEQTGNTQEEEEYREYIQAEQRRLDTGKGEEREKLVRATMTKVLEEGLDGHSVAANRISRIFERMIGTIVEPSPGPEVVGALRGRRTETCRAVREAAETAFEGLGRGVRMMVSATLDGLTPEDEGARRVVYEGLLVIATAIVGAQGMRHGISTGVKEMVEGLKAPDEMHRLRELRVAHTALFSPCFPHLTRKGWIYTFQRDKV